jgi:hypothetical protein
VRDLASVEMNTPEKSAQYASWLQKTIMENYIRLVDDPKTAFVLPKEDLIRVVYDGRAMTDEASTFNWHAKHFDKVLKEFQRNWGSSTYPAYGTDNAAFFPHTWVNTGTGAVPLEATPESAYPHLKKLDALEKLEELVHVAQRAKRMAALTRMSGKPKLSSYDAAFIFSEAVERDPAKAYNLSIVSEALRKNPSLMPMVGGKLVNPAEADVYAYLIETFGDHFVPGAIMQRYPAQRTKVQQHFKRSLPGQPGFGSPMGTPKECAAMYGSMVEKK